MALGALRGGGGEQVYDTLTRDLAGPGAAKLRTADRLGAGCVAGAAATLATYPLETLRTRVTLDQRASLASGPGRAYLGFAASLVRQVLYACLGRKSHKPV